VLLTSLGLIALAPRSLLGDLATAALGRPSAPSVSRSMGRSPPGAALAYGPRGVVESVRRGRFAPACDRVHRQTYTVTTTGCPVPRSIKVVRSSLSEVIT
jgi:hypothetical protein